MKYRLFYTDRFEKMLDKIDKMQAKRILSYLKKNIDDSENPRYIGKSLKGNKSGLWRYRIGNYRIICDIQDKKCLVLALETAHRKDIYK